MTDKEILLNVYRSYKGNKEIKRPKNIPKGTQAITLRAEIQQKCAKYTLFLESKSSTQLEKIKIASSAKTLYRDYCAHLKFNSPVCCDRLSTNMDELMSKVADFEAENVAIFRQTNIAGDKLDLELFLAEEKKIQSAVIVPIRTMLEQYFEKKECTIIGEDIAQRYISKSGEKYHVKDCVYCKGRELFPITDAKIEHLKMKPCRCIAEENAKMMPSDTESKENVTYTEPVKQNTECIKKGNYITVFVDESMRPNIWKEVDKSQSNKQGVYSYIVCKGFLTSEEQITNANTIIADVGLTFNAEEVHEITMEAIGAILLRLITYGFDGHVTIYTDNKIAQNTWHTSVVGEKLGELFSSIRICYIPRETNSKADKLGRTISIADLPAKVANDLIRKSCAYDEIKNIVNSTNL